MDQQQPWSSKRWRIRSPSATLDIKRVPETVPQEIAKAAHFKLDEAAPIEKVDELPMTTPLSDLRTAKIKAYESLA